MKHLHGILRWLIVILPFTASLGPAPTNIVLGWSIFLFLCKKALLRRKPFEPQASLIPLGLLFLAILLSFANTIDLRASFQGVGKFVLNAFVFLIVAEEARDAVTRRRLVWGILAGALLSSINALWQLYSGHDFIRGNPPMEYIGIMRATAAFPHTNILGVYLSALFCFAVAESLFVQKGRRRIAAGAGALVVGAGLLLTYSRGAIIGAGIGVIILCLMQRNRILPAAILAAALLFPFCMSGTVRSWAASVRYDPLRFLLNDDRISMFRNASNMIAHHPVVGVGVNTFSLNYGRYKLAEPSHALTSQASYAHNNFLHMGGEIGLAGLGAFLWFILTVFRAGARAYRKNTNPQERAVHAAAIASLAAFLINGLTETSLYYPRVAFLFWLIAGLSVALSSTPRTNASS